MFVGDANELDNALFGPSDGLAVQGTDRLSCGEIEAAGEALWVTVLSEWSVHAVSPPSSAASSFSSFAESEVCRTLPPKGLMAAANLSSVTLLAMITTADLPGSSMDSSRGADDLSGGADVPLAVAVDADDGEPGEVHDKIALELEHLLVGLRGVVRVVVAQNDELGHGALLRSWCRQSVQAQRCLWPATPDHPSRVTRPKPTGLMMSSPATGK